jgi:hypothetical protein
MKKACMRVGQAIWTMTYTIGTDSRLTIHDFSSDDNDGYMFESTLGKLQSIAELEGRVADRVTIDGTEYEVANKENLYSYKQPL